MGVVPTANSALRPVPHQRYRGPVVTTLGQNGQMHRVSPAQHFVWAQVMRPVVPLVYLDLNHFILMARARGSCGGGLAAYQRLYDELSGAGDQGRVLVTLSGEHVWEMSRIKDPRQRGDVADVMMELSGYRYLLGRPDLARLEFEAGLRSVLHEPADPIPLPLVGTTFAWAFGLIGGFKTVDCTGRDTTQETRRLIGAEAFDRAMLIANLTMERAVLAGPDDDEADVLRAEYGYAPEKAHKLQQSRLDFELDLSHRLANNPRWRRGRLRDLVSAREITHEWLDLINDVLQERHRSGRPVLDLSDERFKKVLAEMPHTQVAVSIKTRYHRDPRHKWTTNDISDIDALSVAYAYCDAVFTDKAARHTLAESRELRSMGTFLPRTAKDLTEWLKSRPRPVSRDFLVPAHGNFD